MPIPVGGAFASLEETRLEVAYYLDTYFNLDRRHSALGYRSPHQFEIDLLNHLSLASCLRQLDQFSAPYLSLPATPMKKQLLTILLLLVYAEGRAQASSPLTGTTAPAGTSIGEFQTLDVTDGIRLFIQDGREAGVRVEAPAALRQRVKTVVTGTMLSVYLDSPERGTGLTASPEVITVYVTSTGLNHLNAAKGAVVSFDHSPTRGSTLAVRLLSGASLAGEVDVTLLDIQLGGGATARVSGAARNLHVRAGERSSFQGPGLRAKRCRAYAAGASAVDLTVEESLDAEAVGDADITYRGPATLTRDVRTQGGRIRRL